MSNCCDHTRTLPYPALHCQVPERELTHDASALHLKLLRAAESIALSVVIKADFVDPFLHLCH